MEHCIAALEQTCERRSDPAFLESLCWADMEEVSAFDLVAQREHAAAVAKLLDALVRGEGKGLVIAEELLRDVSCTRGFCFADAVRQMKECNARLRASFLESSTEAELEQQPAGT